MIITILLACWVPSGKMTNEAPSDTGKMGVESDSSEYHDTSDPVVVNIEGEPLYVYSTATCVISASIEAPTIQWVLEENTLSEHNSTLNLNEISVEPGQSLSCEVYGQENSELLAADTVTIANQPPSDIQISILPHSPKSGVDNVDCSATAMDTEGQELSFNYEWTEISSHPVQGPILPKEKIETGQVWTCTVTISDQIDEVISAENVNIVENTSCAYQNCDLALDLGEGVVMDLNYISAGEEPLGRYQLTRDYYLMTTEVTQGMFQQVMGYDSREEESTTHGDGSEYPAYFVNWHMAAHFANSVTLKHNAANLTSLQPCYSCTDSGTSVNCSELGNTYQCSGYVLPTEGEWEYAARSGTTLDFWTGLGTNLGGNSSSGNECGNEINDMSVTIDDGVNNPPLSDYAWFCGNRLDSLHSDTSKPVALKKANGFGLYDLHGNVWEWTNDGGGCSYPLSAIDPWCGPSSSNVIRGGTWNYFPSSMPTSNRNSDSTTNRSFNTGFRLGLHPWFKLSFGCSRI